MQDRHKSIFREGVYMITNVVCYRNGPRFFNVTAMITCSKKSNNKRKDQNYEKFVSSQ